MCPLFENREGWGSRCVAVQEKSRGWAGAASAAEAGSFLFSSRLARLEAVSFPVGVSMRFNIKVKGGGQECPPHTFTFSTESGSFPQGECVMDDLY
jgi:hypothetical protein